MSDDKPKSYVVLSDMHFGTQETSINDPRVSGLMKNYLKDNGPWQEVIFSGDLLDLNLSTVTKSLEGDQQNSIVGFRRFINELNDPPLSVGNWIYIPGNHDYYIWDLLSSNRVCTNVLSCGKPMGTIPTPYKQGQWKGREAFISGVFPSSEINKVCVEYPDHVVNCAEKKLVVTHGHYLDGAQTQMKSVLNLFLKPTNPQEEVRKMFIETAQYQAIAHAVSYTGKSRKVVNSLFGPDNWRNKIKKFLGIFAGDAFDSALRNKPIDYWQLRSIEFFLMHYRLYTTAPHAFVFGHTHSPGTDSTSRIPAKKRLYHNSNIEVYNAGSFLPKNNMLATFLVISPEQNLPKVSAYSINSNATISQLY